MSRGHKKVTIAIGQEKEPPRVIPANFIDLE
jgi:hypothetical protein